MDKKELFYSIARPNIRDLEEYDPGPVSPELVRISSNENNLGVSEKAMEAIINAVSECNRYGDSRCDGLREKLARKYGTSPDRFVIGNGLDGVFTMLGRAFIRPDDEVVCGELTFSVYASFLIEVRTSSPSSPSSTFFSVSGWIISGRNASSLTWRPL
jgi:histidinol-phosphate aminotransferase